jgi:hypothetical protein
MASKEDVPRVLAASSVFLGLLSFNEDAAAGSAAQTGPRGPVVPAALICLLDLLGHPFPRVRKSVAEQMYVRLLMLEETDLAVTDGALYSTIILTLCMKNTHTPPPLPAAGLSGVLSALTETSWDGPLAAVLGARDSMYPLFGLPVPEGRMGTSADDRALASGAGSSGGMNGGGEIDFSSYGALTREAGY